MFYRTWTSYTKDVCLGKNVNCNTSKLPRKYIAYHLNGKTVNIDGQLNEEAWAEVPWTKSLVGKHFSKCSIILTFVSCSVAYACESYIIQK